MNWHKEGPGGRRGYHHGNLREALISAALELISKKGPAGFTFADAARAAGVSPAAPYRHFRDRDALMADVARRGFDAFTEALTRAWDNGRPTPRSAFERVGRAYLDFAAKEPALFSAMFESGVPIGDVEPTLHCLAVDQVLQAQPVSAGLGVAFGEADIDQRADQVEGGGLGEAGAGRQVAQRYPVAAGHGVEQRLGARHRLNPGLGGGGAGRRVVRGAGSGHFAWSLAAGSTL